MGNGGLIMDDFLSIFGLDTKTRQKHAINQQLEIDMEHTEHLTQQRALFNLLQEDGLNIDQLNRALTIFNNLAKLSSGLKGEQRHIVTLFNQEVEVVFINGKVESLQILL